MKSLIAFWQKELTEQLRTGKLLLLGILFVVFGVMNPAVAKLTPWLLETFAGTLEASGMTLTAVPVTALDSWAQFYKNIPMGLIAFLLIESGSFTKEYRAGTLVLMLTKGLARWKVVAAKTALSAMLWSACYWLCFGITYGYTAYYWDQSVVRHLMLAAVLWWVFGLFAVALTVLFSTLFRSETAVLGATGGVVLLCSLAGVLPQLKKALPTRLTEGTALICGAADPKDYILALLITAAASVVCLAVSIPVFNKKAL